jgi:hypothetical protein
MDFISSCIKKKNCEVLQVFDLAKVCEFFLELKNGKVALVSISARNILSLYFPRVDATWLESARR